MDELTFSFLVSFEAWGMKCETREVIVPFGVICGCRRHATTALSVFASFPDCVMQTTNFFDEVSSLCIVCVLHVSIGR